MELVTQIFNQPDVVATSLYKLLACQTISRCHQWWRLFRNDAVTLLVKRHYGSAEFNLLVHLEDGASGRPILTAKIIKFSLFSRR